MRILYKRRRPVLKDASLPNEPPNVARFIEIAQRASSIKELRMLKNSAIEWECLTQQVKEVMSQRAAWLKEK